MEASDLLLDQLSRQVKEIFPSLHTYQTNTIAACMMGIVQSGTAVMHRMAETMKDRSLSKTKMSSYERRFQRFVANKRIDVKSSYAQFLQQVLPHWKGQRVTLVLDPTPYTNEATIVYFGFQVRGRMVPLGWKIMPQVEKWDEEQWEIVQQLFEEVAPFFIPTNCTLLADRGLSCLTLVKLCQRVGWHDVLRIKNDEWCRRAFRRSYRDWEQGSAFVEKKGQKWYGKVLLWKEHAFETYLSSYWDEDFEEAWHIISDRPASRTRITEYAQRMDVEATFQDYKSRFLDIEFSQFKNKDHLNRWLFVVFLAVWWMIHLAGSCIHEGDREHVDRVDRREKGLLRIGHLWLLAILKRANLALYYRERRGRILAQLANCLPFSHCNQRLHFTLSLR